MGNQKEIWLLIVLHTKNTQMPGREGSQIGCCISGIKFDILLAIIVTNAVKTRPSQVGAGSLSAVPYVNI